MFGKRLKWAWVGVFACAASGLRAEDTGTLKGTIQITGKTRPVTNLFNDVKTIPECASQYPDQKVRSEEVVAPRIKEGQDDPRFLQNVIVYIKSDFGGKTFPAPSTTVTLDQKGCVYHPHVLTLQTDQQMIIQNSDPTMHNINGQAEINPAFNKGQNQQGMKDPVSFKKPEIFKVKCDVHKWMGAWIGVFSHPFHAVTDGKGGYEIKGLPAGEYDIVFWHEVYGQNTEKVSIKAGENTKDFNFKAEEEKK